VASLGADVSDAVTAWQDVRTDIDDAVMVVASTSEPALALPTDVETPAHDAAGLRLRKRRLTPGAATVAVAAV
jgi:hypothetical protein